MIAKKLRTSLIAASLLLSAQLWALNTKESVSQVSGTVTLTTDVDYVVTSATPFTADGVVNIENTDHAVLILSAVKPSAAQSLLASHVLIGGEKAVNNTNCQVKLYNRGCIILPYGNATKPLTVFSEQNFEGEQCSDFGLESSGGFMNTLTDKKLNNRIRSFRLKRGYMVTFSLLKEGRGYSRCFIAADRDLEMAELPAIMDRSISSYRIFKWYDTGKPALANDTRAEAVAALNVTSCYSFGPGESRLPNAECVPHHIHEGWPSPASLGQCNYSPHMKTNNEPRNGSDDQPATLDQILGNWQELMRTGMRLCSPSSWDGSDYWNGTGFLKEFFDSIDARGWRCDIVDLHCYWPEGNFGNVKNWTSSVHRPVWISEWCWGASWNSNGAFANGVTEAQVRDALQRICTNLNSYDCVERYYYWNSERDISKIYRNSSLTPAGQMYSQLDGGVGYNGKYDYVPKAPKQMDPENILLDFVKKSGTASVAWREYNGEMNEYIHLERRKSGSEAWEVVIDSLELYEEVDRSVPHYVVVYDIEAQLGWEFRVSEKDANGVIRRTRSVMVADSDVKAGDAINVGDRTFYQGGNVFVNGNFDFGLQGWQNGLGEPLAQPWYQAVQAGGSDGGPYLQCYGHSTSMNVEQSVKVLIDIKPDTYYYFSADACNLDGISKLFSLTRDGTANDSIVLMLNNTSSSWNTQFATFYSGAYTKAMLSLRSLKGKSQFDNFMLRQLFDTKEEAYADGARQERLRAEACIGYFGHFTDLADQLLTTHDDAKADMEYVSKLVEQTISAWQADPELRRLHANAKSLLARYPFPGHEEAERICADIDDVFSRKCLPTAEWILDTYDALQLAMENYLPMTATDGLVKSPDFESATGWQTKAGTYKDGDQRVNQYWGDYRAFPFWNAWWDIPKEGNESQTMAIRQEVGALPHGLYALACRAATEHFCLSDQHAYIVNGTDSLCSPLLTADFYDLPLVHDTLRWQRLTTMPLYVDEDGTLTIGFEGSKQGAADLAWRRVGDTSSKGDHREGWWGATNFQLLYHPLYRISATPDAYATCCLPYAVAPSPGLTFYQIAGITHDCRNICIEEISETQAGVPFIYKSSLGEAMFLEHGKEATSATDGPGNLRGFLKLRTGSSRVPAGYYVLTDGKWQKVQSDNRPLASSFCGIIRPFNDRSSKPFTIFQTWDGPSIPIEGITDEEIAAGIGMPAADGQQQGSLYTLSGQPVGNSQPHPGIYVRIINGKATKTIIK